MPAAQSPHRKPCSECQQGEKGERQSCLMMEVPGVTGARPQHPLESRGSMGLSVLPAEAASVLRRPQAAAQSVAGR